MLCPLCLMVGGVAFAEVDCSPLETAELVAGEDNALSVQGLSDREVVLSFPGVDSYTAVLIRDDYFVKIIKAWFENRFQKTQNEVRNKQTI